MPFVTKNRRTGVPVLLDTTTLKLRRAPGSFTIAAANQASNSIELPDGPPTRTVHVAGVAQPARYAVPLPTSTPSIVTLTKDGIPKVTLNEIKRLGDTGISRYHNVDAFLVGAAANAKVKEQLGDIGLKYASVTAPNVPALANTVGPARFTAVDALAAVGVAGGAVEARMTRRVGNGSQGAGRSLAGQREEEPLGGDPALVAEWLVDAREPFARGRGVIEAGDRQVAGD